MGEKKPASRQRGAAVIASLRMSVGSIRLPRRQATGLGAYDREVMYAHQLGVDREAHEKPEDWMTPAQRRRRDHKLRHGIAAMKKKRKDGRPRRPRYDENYESELLIGRLRMKAREVEHLGVFPTRANPALMGEDELRAEIRRLDDIARQLREGDTILLQAEGIL